MTATVDHSLKNQVPQLDEDCSAADLIYALQRLQFERSGFCRIEIDVGIRDYLLRAVTALHRKATCSR